MSDKGLVTKHRDSQNSLRKTKWAYYEQIIEKAAELANHKKDMQHR